MIKKIFSLAVLALSCMMASAQAPTPLPLDPNVKHGVLPNGLNYYILHNEEPKDRANFYIAQKVGSTLETPQQLGLAHFLEHMAFNGTANYPGKAMLNYLQNKGIRFGADINAYTSFDETVYNINNIPTSDKNLMDSVLLVLYDWSGSILLEDAEIDAERGVIQEEWRMRNDANTRFFTAALPVIYKEYQYQQMPIGKMDIVMNFPYQDLRDYYNKWYRPDQQGIVIVGDFDADEMEKKVVELFSKIEMPANAAPRVYPEVSDNVEPIYFAYSDPEATETSISISFKSDKMPFEVRNTDMYFIQDFMTKLIANMVNNRLEEASKKADCPYSSAYVYFGDFYVSKTKDSFNIEITAKDDEQAATAAVLGIVAQAFKTGFSESEYTRAKDNMLSLYEKLYNERDKRNNGVLAKELIRAFIDNLPTPGIEMKYNLIKQLTAAIPLQVINQLTPEIMTPENQVIVVYEPEKEGKTLPAQDTMVATVEKALNSDYEAYVDEVITDPLIEKLPKKGSVKSVAAGPFESTEFTLSNGVKVVIKPTDFASDEILFSAVKKGGMNQYSPEQGANLQMIDDAVEYSKLGKFDNIKLEKYLAGKRASVGFTMSANSTGLSGNSTVKDLPTLMELVYSYFTQLNPDVDNYTAEVKKDEIRLAQQMNDPQMIFVDTLYKTWFNNDKRIIRPTVELMEEANYPEMLQMAKDALANAQDYTFYFVGNVDAETLKPLLEQYIATLPVAKKSKNNKNSDVKEYPIARQNGIINVDFKQEMNTPSTMYYGLLRGTNVPYSAENEAKVALIGEILGNIYTNTIREEEGGAYSPGAVSYLDPVLGEWIVLSVIQTNADQQKRVLEIADEQIAKLLKEGASAEDFNKVKEAAINQYKIKLRKNSFWRQVLSRYDLGYDIYTGGLEALENLTLDEFNAFIQNLYDGKNAINVMMEGVPVNK